MQGALSQREKDELLVVIEALYGSRMPFAAYSHRFNEQTMEIVEDLLESLKNATLTCSCSWLDYLRQAPFFDAAGCAPYSRSFQASCVRTMSSSAVPHADMLYA